MNHILNQYLNQLHNPWIIIGFLGQFFFFGRFVIQWIASEKKKESHIPVAFWYFSITGTLLILAYSISIGDIVFTLGSSLNIFIYIRNLVLISNKKKEST